MLCDEQVRELLRGQTPTRSGSGEGASTSCSELEYLEDLCESTAQLIKMKKSVEETAATILTQYRGDEGLDRCSWLHSNSASQYIKRLFNC